MEGFPRDVQTIILRKLAGTDEPGRLYDLFRVNHMFRSWVTRFVWDYCVPVIRIYRHIKYILKSPHIEEDELLQWDVINQLKAQWENNRPCLFPFACALMFRWVVCIWFEVHPIATFRHEEKQQRRFFGKEIRFLPL